MRLGNNETYLRAGADDRRRRLTAKLDGGFPKSKHDGLHAHGEAYCNRRRSRRVNPSRRMETAGRGMATVRILQQSGPGRPVRRTRHNTLGRMRSTITSTPAGFGWIPSAWLRAATVATPSSRKG